MPEAQGVLNLCLPAVVLNAILRRLIAEGDRPRRRSKEAQIRMRDLLGQVKVGTLLQFPQMRLRASEVASLEPGTILRLPLAEDVRLRSCASAACTSGARIRCGPENIVARNLRANDCRRSARLRGSAGDAR